MSGIIVTGLANTGNLLKDHGVLPEGLRYG